jgi:malonyl-CoA O-methyltransferase
MGTNNRMIQSQINKKRVEQSFKKSINSYNKHAVVQKQICNTLLQALIDNCGTSFPQVLEIGAGTGLLTEKLIHNISIKNLYLNDLVVLMQTALNEICNTEKDIKSNFIMGDAETISFIPKNNLIISASTVQWFENISLFFTTNIKQLLTPSGIFAFSTFGPDNMKEISSIEGNTLHYPALVDLLTMLELDFDIIWKKEELISIYFNTPMDVLMHIKQTGVNGIESTHWTKKDVQRFCDSYNKYFIEGKGYKLSYHPIYIIVRKRN